MGKKELVTVYSPKSFIKRPGELFSELAKDIRNSRELAWRLFLRNIKAQYRQSFFGVMWAFLPPLFTALVWIFLKSQKVLAVEDVGVSYPVYVFCGVLLWQIFVDAINMPIKIMGQSRTMLIKINFPREAILMAAFGQVVFGFLIRLILMVIVFIYFGEHPHWETLALVPVGVIGLILVGMMFGILLAPISLLYKDIQQSMPIITQFWFFLTPIAFAAPKSGWGASVFALNPVTPVLKQARDWLLTGDFTHAVPFCIVTGIVVFLIFVGLLIFKVSMPHLIARVGS